MPPVIPIPLMNSHSAANSALAPLPSEPSLPKSPARNLLDTRTSSEPLFESVPEVKLFRAEVLQDLAALHSLEPAWQELADHASEPNPFYEPWAALPALEAFDPQHRVQFVAVTRACPSGKKGRHQLCGLF